jgi:hypothetical protein
MAILIFVLSLVLLVIGAASAYQSVDLLPDAMGIFYALAGAVGVAAALVTFAVGVAILRIDALAKLVRKLPGQAISDAASDGEPMPAEEAILAPALAPAPLEAQLPGSADEPLQAEDESPININRTGHLPSLDVIETVLQTPESPETPPSMIGSYSSAGANYKIFADGSIEAETTEGTFKFASMGDFKRHLVEAKAKTAPEVE